MTQQGEEYLREEDEGRPSYDPLEENWEIAKEYYFRFTKNFDRLRIISWKLAFVFKAYILKQKYMTKEKILLRKWKKIFGEILWGSF